MLDQRQPCRFGFFDDRLGFLELSLDGAIELVAKVACGQAEVVDCLANQGALSSCAPRAIDHSWPPAIQAGINNVTSAQPTA